MTPSRGRFQVPYGAVARGCVRPPGSKSLSHRFLNLALLHQLRLEVHNLLRAEDLDLFRAALDAMGWSVGDDGEILTLDPPRDDSCSRYGYAAGASSVAMPGPCCGS